MPYGNRREAMSTGQRIKNVRNALFFAKDKIPSQVVEETGMAAYQAVRGIIPALLASLAVVTLTTVLGAAGGAVIGSLGAGVGAVPLGIAGGSAGFEAGLWILSIVGLAFLVEYMGNGLWEAMRHIQ
ncbi:MAG TPA: hypothetical protein PLL36_09775, partial [Candidatus Hydrogenedentes bacterium]|nr:hypothetical protein [Candidatus Hydrogenedentota bacterium]